MTDPCDDAREVWAQSIRSEATACNRCGALGAHEIAGRMIRICAECLPEYEQEQHEAEEMDAMVGGEES